MLPGYRIGALVRYPLVDEIRDTHHNPDDEKKGINLLMRRTIIVCASVAGIRINLMIDKASRYPIHKL